MFNRTIAVILVAALAAGLGLWTAQRQFGGPAGPILEVARLLPEPRDIAPFSLAQSDGTDLTPDELTGRWTLVFFGFTHCPDICPTTLAELAQAEKRWIDALPESQRPRILLVSVDPERDSPERTGEYAGFFTPHALAATGPVEALEAFGKSLLLVFAKAPLPGADPDAYTMDHSSQVVLIDPDGRFAGFIRPQPGADGRPAGMPPAAVATDMIALARWQP
jgi:protein SCO1/2